MTPVNDDVSELSPPAAYELGRSDERIVLQAEIARLRAEVEQLRQAVGLATTIKPEMVLRPNDPVGMMQEVVQYVNHDPYEDLRAQLAKANAVVRAAVTCDNKCSHNLSCLVKVALAASRERA